MNSKKHVPKHGESLVAKKSGVIMGLNNRGVIVKARDALFVPSLRENLMSVKKLTIAGVEVLFNEKIATLALLLHRTPRWKTIRSEARSS